LATGLHPDPLGSLQRSPNSLAALERWKRWEEEGSGTGDRKRKGGEKGRRERGKEERERGGIRREGKGGEKEMVPSFFRTCLRPLLLVIPQSGGLTSHHVTANIPVLVTCPDNTHLSGVTLPVHLCV